MILYYDCFAGISGDMHLAAMLDLGVDPQYLLDELNKLNISGYSIKYEKKVSKGISGTKITVNIDTHHNHKNHNNSHHHHPHRSFKDIKKLIEDSSLNDFIKKTSIEIFQKIATAESKIHNVEIEDIHFHEIGAIDSIVDIVGAAICIDYLKPEHIICSLVELGSGIIHCAHGTLPVPAPATLEILKGIPVKSGLIPFEATTPTGAGIVATLANEFNMNIDFKIEKIGYGIGHKESDVPNIFRIVQGIKEKLYETENAIVIECNIDDMNPELYDYMFEKLFEKGAQDVFITPIIMKKTRPAQTLSVLCSPYQKKEIITLILENTTTLGVRTYFVEKYKLKREIIEIKTSYGNVKFKKSYLGNSIKIKPEYEDCIRIAKEHNIPIFQLIQQLIKEIDS